jgi:hypothetical protein
MNRKYTPFGEAHAESALLANTRHIENRNISIRLQLVRRRSTPVAQSGKGVIVAGCACLQKGVRVRACVHGSLTDAVRVTNVRDRPS